MNRKESIESGAMDAIRASVLLKSLKINASLEASTDARLHFRAVGDFLDIEAKLSAFYGPSVNTSNRENAIKRVYWKVDAVNGRVLLEQNNLKPCYITFLQL